MNYFARNKWAAIVILLLITLNIATLSAFWLMRGGIGRHAPGGDPKTEVFSFLVKELSLDSAQQQQLTVLKEDHQQKMREIRKQNREAKDALFALLKDPATPDSMIDKAGKVSAAVDAETDMITFRHFQEIRKLCNEEQKVKFDHIIDQVLRMIAPPPPGAAPQRPPMSPGAEHPDGPPPPGDDRRPPPPQQQ